ncbi:DUF389 domain-containing protein [Flavobacteriaceae bacterium LMO-SS05]
MDKDQRNLSHNTGEDTQLGDGPKEAVEKKAKDLLKKLRNLLSRSLGFRHETDRKATIETIKNEIPFKGTTVWILICSIFVASVGLNYNSTAVVIGAMLISPLMGPILGIGMSIAINDIAVLRKSLINFAIMIGLSILTAYLFFEVFPLRQDSSELISRTRPDIRDVLIAFFGGSALIIAKTKKGTIAPVIFGVAIATALMPPLCTVGYGLAKGFEPGLTEGSTGYSYALGALYLFTINTIFIACATFLVLKVLRFPMMKYENSKKQRFVARLAMLLAVVVMIPAAWTFIKILQENRFEQDYKKFIQTKIENNEDLWLRKENLDMKNKIIKLDFNGEVDDAVKTDLQNTMQDKSVYPNIYDFKLQVNGDQKRTYKMILGQLDKLHGLIDEKDNLINGLKLQVDSIAMISLKNDGLDLTSFVSIVKETKARFKDLQYFSYAKTLESKDFLKADTLTVVTVKWNPDLTDSLVLVREKELTNWLKQQFKSDKILVKH